MAGSVHEGGHLEGNEAPLPRTRMNVRSHLYCRPAPRVRPSRNRATGLPLAKSASRALRTGTANRSQAESFRTHASRYAPARKTRYTEQGCDAVLNRLCVCAGPPTSPLSASAQAEEEGASAELNLQESAPPSEAVPEEPALQLQLDDAGVQLALPPPRTPERLRAGGGRASGEASEDWARRLRCRFLCRWMFFGFAAAEGLSNFCLSGQCTPIPKWVYPMVWTGTALLVGGFAGMVASGVLLRRRKRERDSLRQAHYATPRRVQWDLARSRLVF